jgi:hypothetical protein
MVQGVLDEDVARDREVVPEMTQVISHVGIQNSTKTFPRSVAPHALSFDSPPSQRTHVHDCDETNVNRCLRDGESYDETPQLSVFCARVLETIGR